MFSTNHHHRAPAARRFLPGLCFPPRAPPPLPLPLLFFILPTEKPPRSPLLTASPLLEKRFLPPKPNFWSRFCRLPLLPPAPGPRSRPDRSLVGADSTAMDSKMSASSPPAPPLPERSDSRTLPGSLPLRSARRKNTSVSDFIISIRREGKAVWGTGNGD